MDGYALGTLVRAECNRYWEALDTTCCRVGVLVFVSRPSLEVSLAVEEVSDVTPDIHDLVCVGE